MELTELRADMPMMTVSGHTDDTLKQDVDFETCGTTKKRKSCTNQPL